MQSTTWKRKSINYEYKYHKSTSNTTINSCFCKTFHKNESVKDFLLLNDFQTKCIDKIYSGVIKLSEIIFYLLYFRTTYKFFMH